MNLSRNVLFCLEVRLCTAFLLFSALLFGCSPNKNNTEYGDKETQLLQGNESKKPVNSENKMVLSVMTDNGNMPVLSNSLRRMVPAVMTGDGRLQSLYDFSGGNIYAFKVDVEEGYFSDNGKMTVSMAKNILPSNAPVLLYGKVSYLGENKFLFDDGTGTIVIKINKNLWDNIPTERNKMVEITGKIVLKYPESEIEVETVRECKP